MRGDNCVIFTSKDRQELRVVFDPDGAAFFCGADLAAMAGYTSPRKAVSGSNQGVNRIDTVLRRVPWDNGMKRARCDMNCFSAENAVKFLHRRPAPFAVIRWFEDEVIPKTQEIGEEAARGYVRWPERRVTVPEQTVGISEQLPAGASGEAIARHLDAIILECALLKRELCQAK